MSRYVRPSGDAPEYTDALKAQVERLNAALQWEQNRSERIGTHWDGCHLAGHQHYECLLRENERLTAELADYRKALEVRNKQLGVACMKHDLVHSLACGICLTETRDLAEHWAILAEQRRVELGECRKDAERWNLLPMFAEEYQINLMKLFDDINSAMEAKP
mgnify:CR=1 FL=1